MNSLPKVGDKVTWEVDDNYNTYYTRNGFVVDVEVIVKVVEKSGFQTEAKLDRVKKGWQREKK